jgi:hypothetical protein
MSPEKRSARDRTWTRSAAAEIVRSVLFMSVVCRGGLVEHDVLMTKVTTATHSASELHRFMNASRANL